MKKYLLILPLILLMGCFKTITPRDVVLLPEDRIYTVPAGQKVHVSLDKKDLGELTFPFQMKLVHESILERNEQQLNDIALKKVKADQDNNKKMGVLGGFVSIISGLFGMWLKGKFTKKEQK